MDPTFVEKGFKNWKKCPEALKCHDTPEYHCDYVKLLNGEETTDDIADEFSDIHIRKKANNRHMFLQVLQNIQFLTRQGLAFRNDSENFDQLLTRCEKLDLVSLSGEIRIRTNFYISILYLRDKTHGSKLFERFSGRYQ